MNIKKQKLFINVIGWNMHNMTIKKLAMIITSIAIFVIVICRVSSSTFVFYNLFVSIVVVFYFMSLSRPSFVSCFVEICVCLENMEHGIIGRLLGAKIICFVVVSCLVTFLRQKKLKITLHERVCLPIGLCKSTKVWIIRFDGCVGRETVIRSSDQHLTFRHAAIKLKIIKVILIDMILLFIL